MTAHDGRAGLLSRREAVSWLRCLAATHRRLGLGPGHGGMRMVVDTLMASVGVSSGTIGAEADSAGHGPAHRDRNDRWLGRRRARAPRSQQLKVTSQ